MRFTLASSCVVITSDLRLQTLGPRQGFLDVQVLARVGLTHKGVRQRPVPLLSTEVTDIRQQCVQGRRLINTCVYQRIDDVLRGASSFDDFDSVLISTEF